MKFKHTPGKLYATFNGYYYEIRQGRGKHNPSIANIDVNKFTKPPCDMETAKANARLLATAPEMLEALIEFLEWGPMTQSDRHLHESKFKKLIEKATGLKIEEVSDGTTNSNNV